MSQTAEQIDHSTPDATLPARYYTDKDVFAAECRAIHFRSWHLVGHVCDLPDPGDYLTTRIVNQSIIVLRGADGTLRAFFNVCRHRAHELLEGTGTVKLITCPYHAWTYGTDGTLRHARNGENVPGFDPAANSLRPVALEEFCGLLFVNLDGDAKALADTCPGLKDDLSSRLPANVDFFRAHRHTLDLKANWKVCVENFSECYHCEVVHKSLTSGVLDPSNYHITVHEGHHRHLSTAVDADKAVYRFDKTATPHADELASFFVWPACAIQIYPGGYLNTFRFAPIATDHTRLIVDWYVTTPEPSTAEKQMIESHIATTLGEDIEIVESVQRGLESLGYDTGTLMVDNHRSINSEHSIADLQRRVRAALDV